MSTFAWPVNCLFMLGLTACISLLCVPMVRRVSLKRAMGGGGATVDPVPPSAPNLQFTIDNLQLKEPPSELAGLIVTCKSSIVNLPPPLLPASAPPVQLASPRAQVARKRKWSHKEGIIHRVRGSAIVWKETRGAWVFRGVWSMVSLILCLTILALIDTLFGILGVLHYAYYHAIIMSVLTALAIVAVSVTSATTISTEKESRSLPVLLTTPMGDGHILLGKFVGVLRRCIGSFIPMTGHLVLFVIVGLVVREGFIHPIALPHMALIIGPMLWFYISSGLYFGSKFKKTTAAVVLNLGLALVLTGLVPILTRLMVSEMDLSASRVLLDGNPVVQAFVLTAGDGWGSSGYFFFSETNGEYNWPSELRNFWDSTVELLRWASIYFVAGSLFLWRARANLRKNIF
jgi:ABC-type transport system involved in multi-copper enzyme maturation permease subunit